MKTLTPLILAAAASAAYTAFHAAVDLPDHPAPLWDDLNADPNDTKEVDAWTAATQAAHDKIKELEIQIDSEDQANEETAAAETENPPLDPGEVTDPAAVQTDPPSDPPAEDPASEPNV